MSKAAVAFISFLYLVALASVARGDDSDLRAVLQNRYATMKAAMSAHDDKVVLSLLTTDFVSIDTTGQSMGPTQMIQEVDSLPKDPNKTSTTTIVSIKRAENTAIVGQRYDMKTVKVAADGSSRNVELVSLSTDTWVKFNGSWLLQKTETDQIDYYVDGQLVTHRVRSQ
jgi:hypothetical protein